MKSRKLQILLYAIITCLLPISAWAFQPQKYLLQHQSWGVEDGWPSFTILSMLEGSNGYLWIASDKGVYRFDGNKLNQYKAIERAKNIAQDKKGNIWIGRSSDVFGSNPINDISLLDPDYNNKTPIQQYLPDSVFLALRHVIWMKSDTQQNIWWYTSEGNLFCYTGKKLKLMLSNIDKPIRRWNLFSKPNSTDVWLGYQNRLCHFNTETLDLKRSVTLDSTYEYINIIHWDTKKNDIWYSVKINNTPISFHYSENGKSTPVAVYEDLQEKKQKLAGYVVSVQKEANQIWWLGLTGMVITDTSLNVLQTKTYQNFDTYDDANRFVDSNGTFWNNYGGKLHVWNLAPSTFRKYLHSENGLQGHVCRGIRVDEERQMLYVLGMLGIKEVDLREGRSGTFTGVPALDYTWLSGCWGEDRNGGLYFTSQRAVPLVKTDKEQPLFWKNAEPAQVKGFKNTNNLLVWSLYTLTDTSFLLGTHEGLRIANLKNQTIYPYTHYQKYPELASQEVFHIQQRKYHPNELWLGTGNGIYVLDTIKGLVRHCSPQQMGKDSLPSSTILHLYEQSPDTCWLACKGGGLIRWNPTTGEYKQYLKEDGLSDNTIYAVYPDDYGNLWMSSNRGIMQFNRQSEEVSFYLLEDGLTHNEFNTKSHAQDANGNIYFGGLNGITAFHPKDFQRNLRKASMSISTLQIQDRATGEYRNAYNSYSSQKEITLSPDDLGFVASIGLPDFLYSKDAQYFYKITDIDKNWVEMDAPSIRINSLDYGNYTLEVKAKTRQNAAHYQLTVPIQALRPFYLETWFILTGIIALVGTVWLLFQARLRAGKLRQKQLEQQVMERTQELYLDKQTIEKQSAELKKLDELKSKFFANVSHELRTPMTLILGPVQHLLNKEASLSDNTRNTLQIVGKNGRQLLALISQILDLSKLEAGKLALSHKNTELQSFFAMTISQFEMQAKAGELVFEWELMPLEGVYAQVDVEKLQQVMNNLLSNAFKFTPMGKKVHLLVEIKEVEQYHQLSVTLTDEGVGIHPDDLPHIFERYFQTKQENAPAQGGTGIGLALCKEFVELMEGTITVTSELGKGSVFAFTVPLKSVGSLPVEIPEVVIETESSEFQQQPDFLPPATKASYKPHILLAEDNPDMQQYIKSVLQEHYRLTICNNGADALKRLEEGLIPDLIVSDIMMPVMDGFALLKQVKQHPSFRQFPMIMLTALADMGDKLKALHLGIDDYLTKPFMPQELLARAKNLIERYSVRKDAKVEDVSSEVESHRKITQQRAEIQTLEDQEREWLFKIEGIAKKGLETQLLGVAYIADELQISERKLQRKLKAVLGLTPKAFLTEIQMQEARKALESGSVEHINSLAEQLGFKNSHYFSQKYEERFGKKPIDYLQDK